MPQVWGLGLTETDSTLRDDLGAYRWQDGKCYQYVLFDNGSGDVAAVSGGVAYRKDAATTVTMDVTDSDVTQAAGIFISVPADQDYCWIQVAGPHATVKTNGDDDVAIGNAIVPEGDGLSDVMADGEEEQVIGVAYAADVDADDTVAVNLKGLL